MILPSETNNEQLNKPYWKAIDRILSTFWCHQPDCYTLFFLTLLLIKKITGLPHLIFKIMRGPSWWSSAVTQVVHWLAAAKNNYINAVQMSSDNLKFVEFPEVFWPFICSKQFSTWLFLSIRICHVLHLCSLTFHIFILHCGVAAVWWFLEIRDRQSVWVQTQQHTHMCWIYTKRHIPRWAKTLVLHSQNTGQQGAYSYVSPSQVFTKQKLVTEHQIYKGQLMRIKFINKC